jgi:YfiH family protein
MTARADFILPDWPAHARIHAAQSLRTGGVSQGAFESLNIGTHVGDDPAAVAENRARLAHALQLPSEPLWLEQIHGSGVLESDRDINRKADAVVIRRPGVVGVIQTADCLPVLFADGSGACIGAAHAGWRGLAAGVIEATLHAMRVPAHEITAWLGPAISQEAFEVGGEVREAFIAQNPAAAAAFLPNARGRWQADLYALARPDCRGRQTGCWRRALHGSRQRPVLFAPARRAERPHGNARLDGPLRAHARIVRETH